jgi:hypothetical protein
MLRRVVWLILTDVSEEFTASIIALNGTGSGSCPMADFGISGVEPSGSATRELVN